MDRKFLDPLFLSLPSVLLLLPFFARFVRLPAKEASLIFVNTAMVAS